MPAVPKKVDDVAKTASGVLKDDFQVKGYELKAKQKTSWEGAVCDTTVTLFKAGDCKTPGKMSWKFPKPFGLSGLAVDKLEFAPDGKYAIDTSMTDAMHGVKGLTIEKKATGLTLDQVKVGLSYTGIPDAFVKFETKAAAIDKFTLECLYGVGGAVVGASFNGPKFPTLGANFTSGPFFASVIAKEMAKEITLHSSYKVTPDLSVAKTYQYGGKKNGDWGVAASYKVDGTMSVKAKLESSMTVFAGVKKDLVKGFNILAGVSYDTTKGEASYGCKVSIE